MRRPRTRHHPHPNPNPDHGHVRDQGRGRSRLGADPEHNVDQPGRDPRWKYAHDYEPTAAGNSGAQVSGWDELLTDETADDMAGEGSGWMPEFVEVTPHHIAVGAQLAATLSVVGWPREVFPGWLEPLTTYPARVDVSVHIDPLDAAVASAGLRRQLARLESDRSATAEHARLPDPYVDAATADAYDLAGRVARSQTRLYRVGISLLIRAESLTELQEQTAALRSLAASLLLDARPVPYRALQGWTTCLPLGVDSLAQRRTMDTDALAAAFPFSAPGLPADPVTGHAPTGVLYGYNLSSGGLVFYDRFTQPNHNLIVLAQSGAGKSYLCKLELLRCLYRGAHAIVIDPEDEYRRLAEAVGGVHIRLGDPDVQINPLDLPQPTSTRGAAARDVLVRRSLYLHTVLAILLGQPLTPGERALADRAIHTCYAQAGITQDPGSWSSPAPLLGDLAATLHHLDDAGDLGRELAARLAPYTTGSFSTLFAGPTTTAATGHLVVFCLQGLPEELKAIGTLLALDATWRGVTDPTDRRPRLVVVDEAWLLMQHPAGAQFLLRLAKSARKHWCGLTLITQDAADVLSSDVGRAVVSNAATQILLRTATQAAAQVTDAFGLTEGERAFLTSAERGAGLLIGSGARHRVAFRAHASPEEDQLCTTDPAQLANLDHLADTADDGEQSRRRSTPTGPGPRATRMPATATTDDEDPL